VGAGADKPKPKPKRLASRHDVRRFGLNRRVWTYTLQAVGVHPFSGDWHAVGSAVYEGDGRDAQNIRVGSPCAEPYIVVSATDQTPGASGETAGTRRHRSIVMTVSVWRCGFRTIRSTTRIAEPRKLLYCVAWSSELFPAASRSSCFAQEATRFVCPNTVRARFVVASLTALASTSA
jgi:hypothetical protein